MNNCITFNSLVLVYVYNSLDYLHHRISTEECYFTFFFSFFSMSCIFHIKQINDYNNYRKTNKKLISVSKSSQANVNQVGVS